MRAQYVCILLIFLTLLTRLLFLTELPVFADEAIYIRWAQLIIDEPLRYALFALNDGKTPLYIWMMVPFLQLPIDPLLAGRLVSVLGGVAQVGFFFVIGKRLFGTWVSGTFIAVIGIITPYWFFLQRMALMDAWLTVWITLAFWGMIELAECVKAERKVVWKPTSFLELVRWRFSRWILIAGIGFGLALLTKIPAILALGSLVVVPLYFATSLYQKLRIWVGLAASAGIGGVLFLLLKLHPAFGQLFSRGGDFLYPAEQVFLQGLWRVTLPNAMNVLVEWHAYLGWWFLFAIISGFVLSKKKRVLLGLVLSTVLFMLPILLLGQVIYLRYIMPAAIFLTIAAGFGVHSLFSQWSTAISWRIVLAFVAMNAILFSGSFIFKAYLDSDALPLPKSDRVQYLTEWSSGHGVYESTQYLLEESKDERIFMATEGFFGTLPDGVLMYLHQEDVSNLTVEGVGQPIHGIPSHLSEKKQSFDQIWLLVNSHRLTASWPPELLLEEYCRPYEAPCLQLWNLTPLIE